MSAHAPPTVAAATETSAELHICSLVVHALPFKLQAVRGAIDTIADAEICAVTADGRIVVTLETNGEAEFLMRFAEIDRLLGVVSTMLVFHHAEKIEPG